MHINKSIVRLRPMEHSKNVYCTKYLLEYYKNGNKQNSMLGVVGFSEKILEHLGSLNISYCML
jgi:hypothetical protein